MANWAKLQENLVGLPVAKRAKHGIHFQKSANEFIGNFSGKPCHFQENGIWKPIDTKLLLLPDGYYGCPHSPVRVHKDGHVKVDGSDYTQYTPLLGAPTGLVDNDRIVREFTGGRQYLYVTEYGFRQEIVLDRKPSLKLADARKLLAVEYGSLPLKYVASLLTATDANGDMYTYDKVTNLIAWLNAAVYPVIIDPDIIQPDGTAGKDTFIIEGAGTNYGTDTRLIIGKGTTRIRSLLQFDVSSIASGVTVTAGVCSLYCYTGQTTSDRSIKFHRTLVSWVESQATQALRATDVTWGSAMGLADTDYTATATATTTVGAYTAWYDFDILADVEDWVAGTATNYGNFLIGDESATNLRKEFYSSDYTDNASLRPKLTVTYTAGGTTGNPLMHRWRRI